MKNPNTLFFLSLALLMGSFLGTYQAMHASNEETSTARRAYQMVDSGSGNLSQLAKASDLAAEALAKDPRDPVALFAQGWAMQRRGLTEQSLANYESLFQELNALNSYGHYNAAELYEARGQIDTAVEHYVRSIGSNANLFIAWDRLIRLLTKNGRKHEALEYAEALLVQFPSDVKAQRLKDFVLSSKK